ncbi:MAG: hypothetical protein M1840_005199 [Geoglossum simile]|nr:MAG: hypothetical protein M1840_005199 [Geoglossum simile]
MSYYSTIYYWLILNYASGPSTISDQFSITTWRTSSRWKTGLTPGIVTADMITLYHRFTDIPTATSSNTSSSRPPSMSTPGGGSLATERSTLSPTARVGIGVSAAVVLVILICIAVLLLRRWRRQHFRSSQRSVREADLPPVTESTTRHVLSKPNPLLSSTPPKAVSVTGRRSGQTLDEEDRWLAEEEERIREWRATYPARIAEGWGNG